MRVQVSDQAMVVTLGNAAAELGGLYGPAHLTMWVWEANLLGNPFLVSGPGGQSRKRSRRTVYEVCFTLPTVVQYQRCFILRSWLARQWENASLTFMLLFASQSLWKTNSDNHDRGVAVGWRLRCTGGAESSGTERLLSLCICMSPAAAHTCSPPCSLSGSHPQLRARWTDSYSV